MTISFKTTVSLKWHSTHEVIVQHELIVQHEVIVQHGINNLLTTISLEEL